MTNPEASHPEPTDEEKEVARQQQSLTHYLQYLNSEPRQTALEKARLKLTSNEPQGEQHD
jgi:hypothetical protein